MFDLLRVFISMPVVVIPEAVVAAFAHELESLGSGEGGAVQYLKSLAFAGGKPVHVLSVATDAEGKPFNVWHVFDPENGTVDESNPGNVLERELLGARQEFRRIPSKPRARQPVGHG